MNLMPDPAADRAPGPAGEPRAGGGELMDLDAEREIAQLRRDLANVRADLDDVRQDLDREVADRRKEAARIDGDLRDLQVQGVR